MEMKKNVTLCRKLKHGAVLTRRWGATCCAENGDKYPWPTWKPEPQSLENCAFSWLERLHFSWQPLLLIHKSRKEPLNGRVLPDTSGRKIGRMKRGLRVFQEGVWVNQDVAPEHAQSPVSVVRLGTTGSSACPLFRLHCEGQGPCGTHLPGVPPEGSREDG